ncbi:arf-GAP domain and FG repeat-containing protein 2 isoform 2-T2 [Sylvia borin]
MGCGKRRGLNPPHRVKSISMTTFTEAEVLFLQAHGNEACRRVWLGTFDPRTSLLPDSRDPQKVKEFLQEKYEKKRWYLAPEQVKQPPQSTTAEPGPPQLLHGDTGTLAQPRPAAQRPPQPARKASTDLLADIGGDPFASPAPGPAFAAFPGPAPSRSAFPSFNAFGTSTGAPTFGGAVPPFHVPPTTTGGVAAQGVATPVLPTGGGASVRYCPSPFLPHLPAVQDRTLTAPPPPCSPFGTLRDPPALPHGGYTNPFTAPVAPRPSTNPFQSNGPGASFTSPSVPGAFPSPFQADGLPFGAFNVAKASTNPFVVRRGRSAVTGSVPEPPFSAADPRSVPSRRSRPRRRRSASDSRPPTPSYDRRCPRGARPGPGGRPLAVRRRPSCSAGTKFYFCSERFIAISNIYSIETASISMLPFSSPRRDRRCGSPGPAWGPG